MNDENPCHGDDVRGHNASGQTMMLKRILVAAAATLIATQASAAQCAKTSHVEAQLLARHGEAKTHFGMLPNRNYLQVFLNERSESWSIVVEVPSRGLSCLLSTGHGYESVMSHRMINKVDLVPMS